MRCRSKRLFVSLFGHNGTMPALVAILCGAVFLFAGIAAFVDYHAFGTRMVNTVPDVFRFGTTDQHRRVLGVCWAVLGLLFFVVGIAVLVAYLA